MEKLFNKINTNSDMETKDIISTETITPLEALGKLRNGNNRFIQNLSINRDYLEQVKVTAGGQKPFAAVLGCIDSRAPAEIIFDMGIGDIFNVRIAGNILNEDILGSLEFATRIAGAKLVVILGHTSCGAVKGALDKAKLGHLTGLVQKLEAAVTQVNSQFDDRPASDKIDLIAERNVEMVCEELLNRSEVLAELNTAGAIKIVGAIYDVNTGKVRFK